MPRLYTRKTEKAKWTAEQLQAAILAIKSGRKVRDVGRTFGIAESTLRDRLKTKNFGKPKLGRKPTFSFEIEKELTNHILKLAKYFYGLTPAELRRLAYEYATTNGIAHRFCNLTKSAGYDWLELFLKRNPEISLRTPEGTSLNRVSSFNETNVKLFYKNLEETMDKFKLYDKSTRIFNVDETGITTVQKPSRILGPKGQKQVGSMISWERGKNVTVVCCMNAAGSMFIYPRARVSQLLSRGGPAGSLYECSKNGWITTELFYKWMEHFAKFVKPTILDPVMLIFDNHTSHISIEIYNFCRSNGICIVTLPPHTSHKLQPLDLTFFGPLKTTFNRECDMFLKAHPHEKITMYDLALLFNQSYTKVATMDKGPSGFNCAGIFPLNTDKFTANDFAPAQEFVEVEKELTFEYLPNRIELAITKEHCTLQGNNKEEQKNLSLEDELQAIEEEFYFPCLQEDFKSTKDIQVQQYNEQEIVQINDLPSTSTGIYHTSIEKICPIPKAKFTSTKNFTSRKRKSIVLTSTPMKLELDKAKEKQEKAKKIKQEKQEVLKSRKQNKVEVIKKKVLSNSKNKKSNMTLKSNKIVRDGKRKINFNTSISDEEDQNSEQKCLVCGDFGLNEVWYRCRGCGLWAHALCTPTNTPSSYICDFCQ